MNIFLKYVFLRNYSLSYHVAMLQFSPHVQFLDVSHVVEN